MWMWHLKTWFNSTHGGGMGLMIDDLRSPTLMSLWFYHLIRTQEQHCLIRKGFFFAGTCPWDWPVTDTWESCLNKPQVQSFSLGYFPSFDQSGIERPPMPNVISLSLTVFGEFFLQLAFKHFGRLKEKLVWRWIIYKCFMSMRPFVQVHC